MPPKNKATTRSGKKGKALKKKVTLMSQPHSDSDWTSGGEDKVTVQDLLSNVTTMMASLNTRLEAIEGDGKKRRKVAFRDDAPATQAACPVLQPPLGLPAPEVLETLPMENDLPLLHTIS